MGSPASQGAVGSYMAVPPQETGQADFGLPAIVVGTQVHFLVLDGAPQPLDQDVVVAALPSRPADSDLLGLQPGNKVSGGELTTLVGVEDLWLAATFQRHFQGLQTELPVKAVGELPAEHMPGEEVHDRNQVEEAFLEGDVGDVSRPDLIHSRDQAEIHQAGEALGRVTRNRGARLLVDRP